MFSTIYFSFTILLKAKWPKTLEKKEEGVNCKSSMVFNKTCPSLYVHGYKKKNKKHGIPKILETEKK